MDAEEASAAALLQRATTEEGPEARALFVKAVAAARAEGSARLERDACLGYAELSWQVNPLSRGPWPSASQGATAGVWSLTHHPMTAGWRA